MDAVTYIQKRFYQDYPPHPSENDYLFATPSTMKPTQIKVSTFKDIYRFNLISKHSFPILHINVFYILMGNIPTIL